MKLKISNYQKSDFFTIDDITFDLTQHSSIALVGPPHAGKTTIMNILALREPCETFCVEEQGELTYPFLSNSKKASLARRITTFDQNPFVDFLTTNEQFQILQAVDHQKEYNTTRYEALCTYFEFDPYVNYLVSDLSPQDLQKRQLILTLASNNQYIFMDAPTLGLDANIKAKFFQLINKEKTVGKKFIMADENITTLTHVADYYIFLADGHVQEEGTSADLTKKYKTEINDTLYEAIYQLKQVA
jgi:ABC-type multidrug transport system ATPase subunit